MTTHAHDYIPAAGHDRFLPLYDPLTRLLGARRLREQLIDAAAIAPGARVLDLGCGTGELSLQIAARGSGARITGLDPDPKALALATRKAARAGAAIDWREGYAGRAPFPDASFDRVVSSFVIHHLTTAEKLAAFREARRVLAPGGSLHVLDFAAPRSALERFAARFVHHDGRMDDNLAGRLPALLREAGFAEVAAPEPLRMRGLAVALWAARVPR